MAGMNRNPTRGTRTTVYSDWHNGAKRHSLPPGSPAGVERSNSKCRGTDAPGEGTRRVTFRVEQGLSELLEYPCESMKSVVSTAFSKMTRHRRNSLPLISSHRWETYYKTECLFVEFPCSE